MSEVNAGHNGAPTADTRGAAAAAETLTKDDIMNVLGGATQAMKDTQEEVKVRHAKQDSMFSEISKKLNQSTKTNQCKFEELQRELHVNESVRRSDKIQEPKLRKMAAPYDAAATSLHSAGAAFQDHATGAMPLSVDHATTLASQCAEGEATCLLRVQFYEDWDKDGKEYAEEMMTLRQDRTRDPLELALEKKALKAAEKRRAEQAQLEDLKAKV